MVLSPLISAAVTGLTAIATEIFTESIKDGGEKAIGTLGESLSAKVQQTLFNASREYLKRYAERHGILKVLGMREPVDLDSVYTNVQLLDERDICRFESTEALEKAFRESQQRRFRSKEAQKQVGVEVANQKKYLMVLGAPGAGKSTFLRKMGLEALKEKKGGLKQHRCIPVFLELKRFTGDKIDIEKIVTKEFETCGFPNAAKFTAKALEKGKLLILLDGLDEVPTKLQHKVIEQIQDFVDRYDKNRYIASCRTAAYRSGFRRFSDVVMAEFDDEQIEQFIKNWFHSEQDKQAKTAEACWELLNKLEHKGAKELAQTPLLLTFLCLVYNKSQNFPNNRSVLYRKALRILLEEWAADKRILRDEIYEGLHTELEEILLSEIACKNFVKDKLFFQQRDLVGQIKDFLAGNLNAPQHLDGEAVLDAIAVQQGIFVERAEEIYSFSHLTLQEYLTAQYIVDNNKIAVAIKHVTDTRWKEVFLLIAGLMRGGADELLLLMEKEARKFLKTPVGEERLVPLLQWAEWITKGSGGELTPVAKRAIANANAYANAYAYALVNANALANALANDLANANAPTNANALANAYALVYASAYANTYTYADIYAKALGILIKATRELNELPPIYTHVDLPRLIRQLEILKAQIPDKFQPKELRKTFAQHVIHTWLVAFHLTLTMIDIPEEELEEIDNNYFYLNWLMVQCKQAAVRVSPQTWAGIEDRMLRVVEE